MKGGEKMKKFVILPVLALLLTGGVFALGQQSRSVHASSSTDQTVTQIQQKPSTVSVDKPETTETKGMEVDRAGGHQDAGSINVATDKGSEPKGTETDGPGGHNDPQGANLNHQSEKAE